VISTLVIWGIGGSIAVAALDSVRFDGVIGDLAPLRLNENLGFGADEERNPSNLFSKASNC
jgi:hypothetical protein